MIMRHMTKLPYHLCQLKCWKCPHARNPVSPDTLDSERAVGSPAQAVSFLLQTRLKVMDLVAVRFILTLTSQVPDHPYRPGVGICKVRKLLVQRLPGSPGQHGSPALLCHCPKS